MERRNQVSKHTPGPWFAFNMIHAERGDAMTAEEIGEYVKNCVLTSIEDGGAADRFLFISTGEGAPDICHVGNGPRGPANARLIAAAPKLLSELKNLTRAYVNLLEIGRDRIIAHGGTCDPVDVMEKGDPSLRSARAAIAKAEGL